MAWFRGRLRGLGWGLCGKSGQSAAEQRTPRRRGAPRDALLGEGGEVGGEEIEAHVAVEGEDGGEDAEAMEVFGEVLHPAALEEAGALASPLTSFLARMAAME